MSKTKHLRCTSPLFRPKRVTNLLVAQKCGDMPPLLTLKWCHNTRKKISMQFFLPFKFIIFLLHLFRIKALRHIITLEAHHYVFPAVLFCAPQMCVVYVRVRTPFVLQYSACVRGSITCSGAFLHVGNKNCMHLPFKWIFLLL